MKETWLVLGIGWIAILWSGLVVVAPKPYQTAVSTGSLWLILTALAALVSLGYWIGRQR